MSENLILPQLILFSGLAFDTVLIVMLMDGTFKAGVFVASKNILRKVNKFTAGSIALSQNLRLQRKYVRSWPVLKIYTGSVNFYEEKTALILLDFNISQVVNLLLM